MKIKTVNEKILNDVLDGDLFIFKDNVYLKTNEMEDDINCVCYSVDFGVRTLINKMMRVEEVKVEF